MNTEVKHAQKVASELTNSLESLVPLGTLYFTDLPRLPAKGLIADDGWYWFDPPYLLSNAKLVSVHSYDICSFSPLIQDLCYLMERLYVKITYKLIQNTGLAVLRIYMTPTDRDGNRYLVYLRNLYRFGKPVSWHSSKYKVIMKRLLSILDYSIDHWNFNITDKILIFKALKPFQTFNIKEIGSASYVQDEGSLDFHIGRLDKGESFYFDQPRNINSLEDRLAEVYNTIEFKADYPNDIFESVGSMNALNSPLYNYQAETIAKMYYSEIQQNNRPLPHLRHIRFQNNVYYYLNVLELTFMKSAEFYHTPRGGILAENMGLGKTLICLSLICLTKNEVSEIPEKFISKRTHDYKVQSLLSQCVRVINRQSIPWRDHIESIPENCIRHLEENPGYFYLKKEDIKRRASREKPLVLEEKILLTSATLIVCPDNLFHQWDKEIEKHIKKDFLKVLKIEEAKFTLTPLEMCRYDIVLMSISAYVNENPAKSPLTKIYWKRFIIDEGHSMHQRSTRAVEISKQLIVERKWAVTGTPTSGMTKLHVNQMGDSLQESEKYTIKREFNPKDDLTRLGYLISNFLQIEPWANSYNLWSKFVVKPFIDDKYGANSSLSSLVSALVIRHSSEQIETDILLPPLFHKPVLLEPSYSNKIAINIFTAVLATNAISSERQDKDYMFDPSNKVNLRRLVTNLQRATFYWTGFSIEDLESMSYIINLSLDKQKEDGTPYYSIQDMELLRKSLDTCTLALKDKLWRIVSTIHEMEYFVNGLDQSFYQNFGIGKSQNDFIFGAPQLYSLQKFYYKNRFSKSELLRERVIGYSELFWKDYWQESTKKNSSRNKKNDGQHVDIPKVNEELDLQEKVMLTSKSSAKTQSNDLSSFHNLDGKIDISSNSTPEPSARDSKEAKILGTASAKLSYMVSRLLEHEYTGTKSIVFFQFEDSAYYLSEALDLLGITYTHYATSIPKNERPKKIEEFTNSTGAHCLLMDLKLASHGLTITAARRVYFLNPVWSKSVEAQAIKRAHRIGQLETVHVETLILKNTLEEEMFNKRSTASEDKLQTPVADDVQIQAFISKFNFLSTDSQLRYNLFKAPPASELNTINEKKIEPEELLEPYGVNIKKMIHWKVPLFSKAAQEKISNDEQHRQIPKDQKYYINNQTTTEDPKTERYSAKVSLKRSNSSIELTGDLKKVRFID